MKTQKLFSLDVEVVNKLRKEKNSSKIVNDLLNDFYYSGSNKKGEEIQANIVKLEKEIVEKINQSDILKNKLDKILDKEKKLKEIFKDIPKQILDDFKAFPNMTELALGSRYKDIYKKKFKIKYSRVLEAFRHQPK